MKEFFSMGKTMKKLISVVMSLALLLTSAGVFFSGSDVKGAAAEVVSSMDYYSTNDGPTITHSGVGTVSYGFVMPKFNGKASSELSIADVEKDIQVYVKQENGTNGEWKKIEDVSYFKWNDTWAWEYQSWGGWVCWMKLTETTYFRFHGKTNNINLDYKLELNKLSKYKLTSISTTETNIQADTTGGSATHWGAWTFNGDKSIKYEQIQDDVDHTSQGQKVQRALGVPLRPQQGAAEVIDHGGGHAQEIDAQIQCGQIQHIGGSLHPDENGSGSHHTHYRQDQTADEAQQHGGMNCLAELLLVVGSVVLCGQRIGTYCQTYKQVGQKTDERGVGAHRSQGIVPRPASHHHDIRRVEKKLQHAGTHQRDGEAQHPGENGAVAHVDLVLFPLPVGHDRNPLPQTQFLPEVSPDNRHIVAWLFRKYQTFSGKDFTSS